MKYNDKEREQGAKELQEYIENGFDQFATLPEGFPFKDDLVEAFGSIYMITRDIVKRSLYEDEARVTELDLMKLQKEWDSTMEIFALVDLINDDIKGEVWRGQVYKSYGQILLIIRVIQKQFLTQE